MNALTRFLVVLAIAVVVLVAAVGGFIYAGVYDVSATKGHNALVGAAANALMVRSVRVHARDVVSPVGMDFNDPAVLEKAASHFDSMCRTCHGAPGRKADPWEVYPPVPDLTAAVRDRPWNDSEVFWIIKNGIKDTAMSAFGGSHNDQDIWGLTALIRRFSTMTPAQYGELTERARAKMGGQSDAQRGTSESHESAKPSEAKPPAPH